MLSASLTSDAFVITADNSDVTVFPELQEVSLLPPAVDSRRLQVPELYDRPRNPTFLEGLAKISKPRYLCISFRVVVSNDWEEHRDATVAGQLSSRGSD